MKKNTIDDLVDLMKDNKETPQFIIEWLTSMIKECVDGLPIQLHIDGGFKYYHDKTNLENLKAEARLAPSSEETVTEKDTKVSVNVFAQENEVIDLSPPKEWLYKCDCPKCISGMHFDKEIAESYRKRGELINEVERLRDEIRLRDEMVTQARKAHFETCKNAQSAIEKLKEENICLQELIQEFYEWSRRDYPTEAEVREIMNRYYDLLNRGLYSRTIRIHTPRLQ